MLNPSGLALQEAERDAQLGCCSAHLRFLPLYSWKYAVCGLGAFYTSSKCFIFRWDAYVLRYATDFFFFLTPCLRSVNMKGVNYKLCLVLATNNTG